MFLYIVVVIGLAPYENSTHFLERQNLRTLATCIVL